MSKLTWAALLLLLAGLLLQANPLAGGAGACHHQTLHQQR